MAKKRTKAAKRPRTPKRTEPPLWRRPRVMTAGVAVLLIGATTLFALYGPGTRGAEGSDAEAPAVSMQVLDAGADYYQANCATCHGVDGEGYAQQGIPAPPLDGSAHSWHHSDEQIVGLIRNGGSMMPAVGAGWSEDEIHAVLAYVKTRWQPWQREAQQGGIGE